VDRDVRRDVRGVPARRVGVILLARLAAVVIAVNMLIAAVLFAPWILRRETFSGLIGRWHSTEEGRRHRFATFVMPVVDCIVFWEYQHCRKAYREEREARQVLYGESL